jgi:hypothetical protein
MTPTPTSPRNKRTPSVILLLAALGVLLLLLTTGLLAVRLQPMTGVEMTAAGGTGRDGSSTGESGIVLLGSTSPQSSRHVTVNGADGSTWTLTTNTIDLFQSSYQNGDQQETVKSSDGKKVIAPGTSGSYTFSVKNTGSTLLAYKLWLEKAFQVTADGGESAILPVQVRLSSGPAESRTWLLGSSGTEWVNADALKEIETGEAETAGTDIPQEAVAGELNAGESISYTLEWQWPYETGADENDLLLGNSDNAELTLRLNLFAEAEEPEESPGGDTEAPPGGTETETPDNTEEGGTETETPDNTEEGGTETETPDDTEEGGTETETPDDPGMGDPEDKPTPDDTITRDNPIQDGGTATDNTPTPDDTTTDNTPTPDNTVTDNTQTPDNTPTPDDTITDDGTPGGGPTPDETIVDDEPTPTSGGDDEPTPDYTTVDDEPTPLSGGDGDTGNHFPWGWLLGLFFLILILWRRITITGYLQDENGEYMEGFVLRLEQRRFHKTKEAEVDEDGWFKIRRIPLGKKTLILKDRDGNEIARNELRLKRKGKLRIDDFLEIGEKKEDDEEKVYTEIDMRYRITGFEIYLHQRSTSERMEIETDRWIAHTWFGKKYEPEEDEDET